eukprot:g6627.t1
MEQLVEEELEEQTADVTSEQLVKAEVQEHEEDVTLEQLVEEELQEQKKEDSEAPPPRPVSELSTPLVTSPREIQETSIEAPEVELANENPLYAKDKHNSNLSKSLTEILSNPKTNEENKEIVKEVLSQYEMDRVQHLEVLDGLNTVMKRMQEAKQQLLNVLYQVSIKCNPALESLPKTKVLIQQEQILKKLICAKEVLRKLQLKTNERQPLEALKGGSGIGGMNSRTGCLFNKSRVPDWMINGQSFGQEILQSNASVSVGGDDKFEDFVLEVNLIKKPNSVNSKVHWVSKQSVLDKLEAKRKIERQKLEQKQKEEEEKLKEELQQKLKAQTVPTSIPVPVVKPVPSPQEATKHEQDTLVKSLDSFAISLTLKEPTGLTVPPKTTPPQPHLVPVEAPKSQPQGLFVKEGGAPGFGTGATSVQWMPSSETKTPEPAAQSPPIGATPLFSNLGAFSGNQSKSSSSSLTGVAAFGASSFPRPFLSSFGGNTVAPSLGSLGQSGQQSIGSNEGGFAGITGGFSAVSSQTKSNQSIQGQQRFGEGFNQFSQQVNAFQQTFQQQSQSSSINSGSSVFGVRPSSQNKGLWQMRKKVSEQPSSFSKNATLFFQLESAIRKGDNTDNVKTWLERTKDINANLPLSNIIPLHLALREANLPVVKLLIDEGADVERKSSNYDFTPLQFACASGFLEGVKVLIEHGANIASRTQDGSNSLIIAVKHKHRPVVSYLLDQESCPINEFDGSGLTTLHYVVLSNDVSMILELISKGSDINLQTSVST